MARCVVIGAKVQHLVTITHSNDPIAYDVTVRVRAALPLRDFTGGSVIGTYTKKNPTGIPLDEHEWAYLRVYDNGAAGEDYYYLNYVAVNEDYNKALDYNLVVRTAGDSQWDLVVNNIDRFQFKGDASCSLLSVGGLAAYNGIFARLDFVSFVVV